MTGTPDPVEPGALRSTSLWRAPIAYVRRELAKVPLALRGFVALWSIEVFLVQAITLLPPHSRTWTGSIGESLVRLALDLTFCLSISLLAPRWVLWVVQLLALPTFVALTVYRGYFHQALSVLTLLNQGAEGARVSDAGAALLSPWHLLLLVSFGAKGFLLSKARRATNQRPFGLGLLAAYAITVLGLSFTVKPLPKIATWESVSGLGAMYGYAPTWIAQLLFFDNDILIGRALARAADSPPSQLLPVEAPLPKRDRVVFLQVESLDFALYQFKIAGREVTPFLNRLHERARFYAVRAQKKTGSSDADFVALMGRLPSADVATYKIQGYPFKDSIVQSLAALGYRSQAIHGVSGEFFTRRPAFQIMGFSELTFREELLAQDLVQPSHWSASDGVLLEYALSKLTQSTGKLFQLIITATSHIPFHDLDDSLKTFFPGSHDTSENYFDAIAYVDRELERFIQGVPPNSLLVIYGDHSSQIEAPQLGYSQLVHDGVGCVPLWILDSTENLAQSQSQASRLIALDGTLTLLDAMEYVHHQLLEPAAE